MCAVALVACGPVPRTAREGNRAREENRALRGEPRSPTAGPSGDVSEATSASGEPTSASGGSSSQVAASAAVDGPGSDARPPADLPFRIRISKLESSVPRVDAFPVHFGQRCVSGEATDAHRALVHVEGKAPRADYRLRIRLDGHLSRPLVFGRRGELAVPLGSLISEWDELEQGEHEVAVFAADPKGLVPALPEGGLAVAVCRFRVTPSGVLPQEPDGSSIPAVLLGPEGTLHGVQSGSPTLQIAGSEQTAVALRVTLPDGGMETHLLTPGNYTAYPLGGGDYAFALVPPPATTKPPRRHGHHGRAQLGASGPEPRGCCLGYEHWLTINPETPE